MLLAFQVVLILSVVLSVNTILGAAQTSTTTTTSDPNSYMYAFLALGAALSVGLSVIGSGIAIKTTGTAAISILSERPEDFMKAFLVVAMGEALAIYGVIVAVLLWTKIPALA